MTEPKVLKIKPELMGFVYLEDKADFDGWIIRQGYQSYEIHNEPQSYPCWAKDVAELCNVGRDHRDVVVLTYIYNFNIVT